MENCQEKRSVVTTNKVMDSTAKRKTTITRSNKENTKPASEYKELQRNKDAQEKGFNADLTSKNRKKVFTVKKTDKQEVRPARPPANMKSGTLSQAFLSQQVVQQKKLVAEVTKTQATMPPKAPLGTYKGRVIHSKINSFRQKPASDGEAAAKTGEKSLVPMAERLKKPGHMRREQAKFAASIPRPEPLRPSTTLPHKPMSTSNKIADPAVKPAGTTIIKSATSGAQKLFFSAKPSTAGTSARPGSRNFPSTLNQKGLLAGGKLQVAVVANEKMKKLSGSSTVSQYRVSKETAEERRAKLADWLASKGRTLKRPPIVSTLSKTSKPMSRVQLKHPPSTQPQSDPKPRSPMHLDSNLESQVAAQPNLDPEPGAKQVPTSSPDIMNTTLDLLDNSDMDLPVDPQVRMEDLVVNLCSALEAMEVLSSDDHRECEENVTKECQVEQQMEKTSILEPKEDREPVEVKGGVEILDQKGVKEEGSILVESGDECVEEAEVEAASVVRYSVRTTPYLQNMKRRIQGEVTPSEATGRHRHSSTIKDLKFLTPVRRSCRIQRQLARLPVMLTDHDPTVSSFAELAKLDEDTNAYILRPNPALLETLADQPGEAQS